MKKENYSIKTVSKNQIAQMLLGAIELEKRLFSDKTLFSLYSTHDRKQLNKALLKLNRGEN